LAFILALSKSKKVYDKLPEKNRFILDVSQQILMYISIILVVFFIFLLSLRFPFEKQGTNSLPLSVNIQPYLTNESLALYNETALYESNYIYTKYNLTIQIKKPSYLNFSFNDSDKKLIFEQNCGFVDELYAKINGNDREVKLIIVNSNNSIDGMAHFCGKGDLIIMSDNSSMPDWVLAHELGHVLSAEVKCWKYNLMKEYSRVCYNGANWFVHDYIRDLKPDFLTQEQVNSIVKSIKERF